MRYEVPCPKCRGTGYWRYGRLCFDCKGVGFLRVSRSTFEKVKAQDGEAYQVEHKSGCMRLVRAV